MHIHPLQLTDIDFLTELQPTGWGDLRPNFEYHIKSAFCDPVKAMLENKMVGVGTTIKHEDTAWLALIIVHPEFRNKGIGNTITKALIDSLDRSKFKTIYLDSTDLGFPVYKKNGFEIDAEYTHYLCEDFDKNISVSPAIISFNEKYKDRILGLDRVVSGENREQVLNEYMQTSFIYISGEKIQGVYFPSLYDGLIIADNDSAGIELMKLRFKTKKYASVPVNNKAAVDFLKENNCKHVRISRRMVLGLKRKWKPECLFNRISGAMG